MLKIPVQYVISEIEDHTAGRTTQAPKTKVSLVKGARIVVLALALGEIQRQVGQAGILGICSSAARVRFVSVQGQWYKVRIFPKPKNFFELHYSQGKSLVLVSGAGVQGQEPSKGKARSPGFDDIPTCRKRIKQKEDLLKILMPLQNRVLKKEVGWALILSGMFGHWFQH